MKALFQKLKDIAVAGFFLLLPVYIVVYILAKAWTSLSTIGSRVAAMFGVKPILGVGGSTIVSGLLLIAVWMACGLLVRFAFVAALNRRLDQWLSRYIPGYGGYKAIAEEKVKGQVKILPYAAALVKHQEYWQPAYVVEQDAGGNAIVFLPGAPDPGAGCVLLAKPDQVKILSSLTANQLDATLRNRGKGLLTALLHPTLLGALFSLAVCSAALAQAQLDREALDKDPVLFLKVARKALKWDEPAEPARIVGPIYSVGAKGLCVFLIRTTEGHILINTAMPGSGPLTEAAIRKLGLDPKDIKLLLTGHAHSDHAGAHAYFKKLSGARIAIIDQEKDLLESGGKLDFHYGPYPEYAFEPAKVDWVFADGDILKLGDIAVTASLTNGHTKGSTTFVTNVVDNGKVYTVVFPNGLSINPGYRVAKQPSYFGIEDNYRRTLRTLERLKPDIWLAAHTETHDYEGKLARSKARGVQAWVDPAGYRNWLIGEREKLENEVNRELGITRPQR